MVYVCTTQLSIGCVSTLCTYYVIHLTVYKVFSNKKLSVANNKFVVCHVTCCYLYNIVVCMVGNSKDIVVLFNRGNYNAYSQLISNYVLLDSIF